jgi:hypothetical protein
MSIFSACPDWAKFRRLGKKILASDAFFSEKYCPNDLCTIIPQNVAQNKP